MNPEKAALLDRSELVERVEGDLDLLVALVEAYLGSLPGRMSAIGEAVRSRDADGLADAAHALKGSTANFSRADAYRFAGELEEQGKSGSWTGVDETLARLEEAVEELRVALDTVAEDARTGRIEEAS